MERESFEDEATAADLNAGFVAIKVDREERPDLDAIYMDAVQAMTGGGGWPMSVFLTPDGRPFYGGTYFPDQPRHGMPSFRQLLARIGEVWRDDRAADRSLGDAARRPRAGRPGEPGGAQAGARWEPDDRPVRAARRGHVGARVHVRCRATAAGAARRSSRSR